MNTLKRSYFKHTPKHKQTSNQTILTMFMTTSQSFIQLGSKFNHVDADPCLGTIVLLFLAS